ncbi:sugar ABC transporter ATP-binding protein [Phytomonospora endophytica]|uniref:Simple sugar transport system ATP-binding protein n=1 Tax=Phytomonospora endophytica TaxID=714109 RepID=A0A841G1S4_9ACTN|nr:sugar ABC transporter ATP-binding protein [Phytomonospora endophytica]MBB6038639.1 simple sugar transport system ATP-binding protein [Phytomonospora endophytica]GIG69216.1 sugar ABC transporter ATP-binding protein [Phytomonospora endophytica]
MSPAEPSPTAPVLELSGITKRFAGVTALDDVDFRLFPGEAHALVGENGAGKSTLIKVLTGVHHLDSGTITMNGTPAHVTGPQQAQQAGVSTVYQELNLCPNLSVAENIHIGREPRRLGLVRFGAMRRRARELVARLGLDIDVSAPLSAYSPAIRQLVAIVRAVDLSAKVLILDEPTSSLDREEVDQLFTLMRRLKHDGVAIAFVTHFIDQIYDICERATILRNGRLVGEYPTAGLAHVDLVTKMIGKELTVLDAIEEQPKPDLAAVEHGDPLLRAEGLTRRGGIRPFDLSIHKGEVVGLAGLLGSGRTEIVRLLFGADRSTGGHTRIAGRRTTLRTPRTAIARRLAFCPEDRKTEGLIADLSVGENIILALQAARGWARPLPAHRRTALVDEYIKALRIRPADPDARVGDLSGGNQQKVLLARWLATHPNLLILDEPTRGIDIGAKAEIQRLVVTLAADGMAVVFVSAELEEVLRLSHKVAVVRDRELVAELANDETLTLDGLMEIIASGGGR